MKGLLRSIAALLLVLGLAYAFRSTLLTAYARFFTVHTATPGADAVVILSGDRLTRSPHGVELVQKEFAPTLWVTDEREGNSRFAHLYPSNLEFAQAVLAEAGVQAPVEVIPSLKGGATSTFDEAYDTRVWAEARGWNRVILVTDAFHTRRALYAFEKIFEGSPVQLQMSAAPNEVYTEENWWTSDVGLQHYLTEGLKYPVYLLTRRNVSFVRND